MRIKAAAASIFAATQLFGAAARAHAPPEATGLEWVSTGSGERLVVRTNRGLVVSDDGGETFRLLCNEAFSVAVTEQAPMTFAPDGSPLVGTVAAGLLTGTPDLCTFSGATASFGSAPVLDVVRDPSNADTLYLLTARQGTTENFFVSTNGGVEWSPLGTSDVAYTRVRVAPSNPLRLYRSGTLYDPMQGLVYRFAVSSDGGLTSEEYPLTLNADELQSFVLAVDPTNQDRVYLRIQASSAELPERLLVSADGGQTFTTLLTALDIFGFALSADGATVWVGTAEGVYRSTDRGATFVKVAPELSRVGCLALHGQELFACAVQDNAFGVSVSNDGGNTFTRFLDFSVVDEPVQCPAESQTALSCEGPFQDWAAEILPAMPGVVSDAGTGAGVDAGSDFPPSTEPPPRKGTSSDSGCALSRARPPTYPWALVASWCLAVAMRRRAR